MSQGKTAAWLISGASVLAALSLATGYGPIADAVASEQKLDPKPMTAAFADFRHAEQEATRQALRAPKVLGVPRAKLERIASCESGGDPRRVSAGGDYRGKYQFDRGTWKSNGGSGDPAAAPELEQDMRAALLLKHGGSSPWPNCG
jgi:hypothetical protein